MLFIRSITNSECGKDMFLNVYVYFKRNVVISRVLSAGTKYGKVGLLGVNAAIRLFFFALFQGYQPTLNYYYHQCKMNIFIQYKRRFPKAVSSLKRKAGCQRVTFEQCNNPREFET